MKQDFQKSVVAMIWFGNRVMLAPRFKKTWTGYWGGIGGKVEPEETLHEAMTREIQEEADIFVWYPLLQPRDCYIYPEKGEKVFFFEAGLHPAKFKDVENTEPKKRGDWQLFTLEEALKLKLVPRLRTILEETNFNNIKKYSA